LVSQMLVGYFFDLVLNRTRGIFWMKTKSLLLLSVAERLVKVLRT
jgi:hypothetical protein